MKLTFVIFSLGAGGAERVMSIMANHFADRGDNVSIVTFDDGTEAPFYELRASVAWQPLGTARSSHSIFARLRNAPARILALRRQIRMNRPDAIVSFMDRTNFVTLSATVGVRTPVIVSERNDPHQHDRTALNDALRRVLYRRATAIVVQTNGAASYFTSPLKAKTIVIPNPVPCPAAPQLPERRQNNTLMAMGRFSNEKGFDLLLPAFAALAGRFPDWTLTIWGDGDLRGALEAQRERLGLGARVRMPGRTKTPDVEMRTADVFVLSSRYEGFPNVLAEAMANGAAVLSTNCPSGPADLIESGVNGLLVEPDSVDALSHGLATLMSDEAQRRRLGANAERVTDSFSLARVMTMWESIVGARPSSS
jgi:GalNAc-alpha-(1->4)-GalNAc-alpha-(1->3)-diNAcBac-PP-undecaprenol alpha-1,4-N-acetyl-D-galactosaminyltransferase